MELFGKSYLTKKGLRCNGVATELKETQWLLSGKGLDRRVRQDAGRDNQLANRSKHQLTGIVWTGSGFEVCFASDKTIADNTLEINCKRKCWRSWISWKNWNEQLKEYSTVQVFLGPFCSFFFIKELYRSFHRYFAHTLFYMLVIRTHFFLKKNLFEMKKRR